MSTIRITAHDDNNKLILFIELLVQNSGDTIVNRTTGYVDKVGRSFRAVLYNEDGQKVTERTDTEPTTLEFLYCKMNEKLRLPAGATPV